MEEKREKAAKFLFIFMLVITLIFIGISIYSVFKNQFEDEDFIYQNGLVCAQDYFNGKLNEYLDFGDIDGINKTQVKNLQRYLRALNYDLGKYELEGVFGLATKEAVMKFQKMHGLKIDGIVGDETINAINSACYEPLESENKD
jgi:hypothetical protein